MKRYLFVILLMVFCTPVFAVVPETLSQVVDGQWTLQLTKQNLRGSNFEVLIQNASGGYDTYSPEEVRTFIGTVDEDPSAVAAGYLCTNGVLLSAIFFDGHGTYIHEDDTLLYEKGWELPTYNYPTQPTVSAGHAGTTMYEWGIGYDLDYNGYTKNYGADPAYAMERIEFGHVCMALLFMQDALLKPMVERVIIRSSQTHCPYYGSTGVTLLSLLSSEWQNNQSDALPYCFKMFLHSSEVGGGWAGINGRYCVNLIKTEFDSAYQIGRHELGHNWGANDLEAGRPEGGTIMCGNSFARYCGPTVQDFFNHRDNNTSFLTSIGTFTAVDIAPYAALDVSEFTQTVTSSLSVDVLANDFDANGDALSIDSFDAASSNGGTVTLNGQNLVYTAPGNYLGLDYFNYTIIDSSGMTATGAVVVNVLSNDPLKLYMKFDESTGTVANDESFFAHNGTLLNGFDFSTNGVTGQFGGALNFDGVDDYITLDDYKGIEGTTSRTIAAWIKTSDTNGVIANWGGNGLGERINFKTQNGVGTIGGIRLEVNGGYVVGTTNVCDNQWHHVAVVITDDGSPDVTEALLYVDGVYDGVSASASMPINTVLTNVFRIGTDTAGRYLAGSIDELRVYDIALSQPEIQDLVDGGGVAEAPSPFDTATEVNFGLLNWVSSAAAISNDVYLGTDLNAVANADPNSPEYQGSTTASEYMYWNLQPNTTYYWCVDAVTASGVLPGPVWSFTTDTTVCDGSSYVEQNSSGSKRLHSTGTDVDLAAAGSTGSDVEWLLIPVGDYYYIRNVGDDGLLRAVNATTVDLAPAGTLGEAIKWQLVPYTGDWMFIISKVNGQKLHCNDATTPNLVDPIYLGSNVQWKTVDVAQTDTDPPTPNPATFAVAPAADSDTAISMTATTGTDASGPVEYLFTETSGNPGGTSSSWQTSPSYTDSGLTPETQYTYTVTMRDSLGNTGTASAPASATTQATPDTDPPTPNPATFAVAPAADSDTAISMTATTGTDASGPVEYLFTETSGNPGGTSSGWQTSTSYTDSGLTPETQYTYTVTMRDSLGNTGTASAPASATTQAAPDTDPPTPNPATFAVAPAADSDTAISMTATTGTDASGPVEYLFTETSGNPGGTSSSWQTSPSYTDSGLTPETQYTYTVTMRDALGNTGTASAPASATTQATPDTDPPTPNPATFAVAPAADSDTAISMTATTGTDASGPVEYLFTETSGNPGGTSSSWQTSPSYTDSGLTPETQYTYTVTMRDALGNTGTASAPASATTDPAPLTMYVQAIDLSVIVAGGPNRKGVATVTIYDQYAQPLSGATVYGDFTGDYNESGSAVTDANGQATITTSSKAKNPSFTFTVTNVTASGYTYDPASNVETSDTY